MTTTTTAEPATDDRPPIYGLPDRWYLPHVDSDPDPDLTITHDHENGTVLDGSSPRDGVLEIVKNHRFDWRRNVGIYIPHSRDKFADLHSIGKAAEALRAAGWKVAVEIDDVWRPAAEREGHRAERVKARVDRFSEWGMLRDREGKAWREAERSIADGMPFGEPIKIGHHSERAHRRAFERMDDYMRKSIDAHDYARHLASRADGAAANEAAKHGSRAIMRRIERLEADLRDRLRHRAAAERNKAYGQLRRCALEAERLAEDIAYQKAKLADRAASGEFVAWSRDHVAVGDVVNVEGRWCQVARINPTGVSVRQRWDWDGPDAKPQPVKWHQLCGRRRDGMQLDTPNGEQWPVEDARKVAKWANLLRSQNVSHDRSDTAAVVQRQHVAQAVRIVLGLRRDAAYQEVEAYGEPDDELAKRARALAMYAVYERLQAGETFDDVAATVEPIADTVPAWTMPAGQPQDVRADQLVKGDIIAGVYDQMFGGKTLLQSIVGPVTRGPVVRDRRESGEWATLEVNGSEVETKSWRLFAAHLVGPSRKPAEQATGDSSDGADALTDREGRRLSVGDVVDEYTDGKIGPEPAGEHVGRFRVVRLLPSDGVVFTDRYADRGKPESVAFPADLRRVDDESSPTEVADLPTSTVTPPPADVPVWRPAPVSSAEDDAIDPDDIHRHYKVVHKPTGKTFWVANRHDRYVVTGPCVGDYRIDPTGDGVLLRSAIETHPWGWVASISDLAPVPDGKGMLPETHVEVVDVEARDERVWRGSLVEVANRLDGVRAEAVQQGHELPLEVFVRLSESAPVHEVVRMANRLRRFGWASEQKQFPVLEPARVPVAELGEVWDAPVRSWSHQGVTRTTTAVSVDAVYLETYRPGYYNNAYEKFGWQVVARADAPGQEAVYAVFWRVTNGRGRSWRQVTGELNGRQMQEWDGLPISSTVSPGRPAADMVAWLDGLVAELGDPFPEVMRTSGGMPGPVGLDSAAETVEGVEDLVPDEAGWADVLVSLGVMSGKSA